MHLSEEWVIQHHEIEQVKNIKNIRIDRSSKDERLKKYNDENTSTAIIEYKDGSSQEIWLTPFWIKKEE